jgi:D-alanyl-D-alanine carboxypeptidase (penicillin-binding protein 5/6)
MGVPVDVEEANHFTQTAHLYEWAFYTFSHREVLSADTVLAIVPVEFGEEADSIELIPAEPIIALTREGTNLDHYEREVTLFHQEAGTALSAPITRGDVLGEVTFTYGDRIFGPIALIAAENITLSRVEVIQHEVEETLQSGWVQFAIIAFVALVLLFIIGGIIRSVRKRKRRRARMGRR